MSAETDQIYEFGDFRLNVGERVLTRGGEGGEVVSLTPKVFDLLVIFVENSQHLLEKKILLDKLWQDSFVEEANLNVNVSALRRVLGEKPDEARYIETVPRRGYRFVAEVRRVEPDDADEAQKSLSAGEPATAVTSANDQFAERLETARAASNRLSKQSKLFFAALGLILATALAGILIWKFAVQSNKPDVSNIRTIAVLPFKPLVASQSDAALEMGMASALIAKLSNLEQLTLRPTSAVSKYANAETDPIAAGRELQTEAVLDGKIQRADGRIRVTVELLRVSDGATLWAGSFDDFFTNIFAVQDSISERMTNSLALKLSGSEKELLAKRPTENTEAYALFLQARFFHEQISEEGSRKAIEFYEAATRKDPEFALAFAWTVGALIHLANLNINREENLQKARNAASKAVELDSQLADAHEALATVKDAIDWNFAESETEHRRSVELDPKNADAHFSYAAFLSRFKERQTEAVSEIEMAQRLDPVTMYIRAEAALILLRARRYDEAIAETKKLIELKPDFQPAYILLIRLYVYKSMPTEAEAALNKYAEFNPSNREYATALVYRQAGKIEESEKISREQIARYKDGENCGKYALYAVLLGDKTRAFEFLEKALQRRESILLTLDVDPDWDDLRDDARYQNLRRRIGLTR
jgi:DNA-binding winged helix-turn-helix (wHTH) protein/TolB-like protein/Tfp pilus assembly protein PilF